MKQVINVFVVSAWDPELLVEGEEWCYQYSDGTSESIFHWYC